MYFGKCWDRLALVYLENGTVTVSLMHSLQWIPERVILLKSIHEPLQRYY